MAFHTGWVNDPVARATSFSRMVARGHVALGALPITGTGAGKDVFLWVAEQKVLGKLLPSWDQGQIGSCVSHGTGRGAQDLLLCQIAAGASEELPAQVCREAIYGGSRHEVGQDKLGSDDGSVGAWAAEWLTKWGVILYQQYGSLDLTGGYDIQRCKTWGQSGCPDTLEPEAKKHPVKNVTPCTSFAQAQDLIANGYPVPVCSDQGFAMQRESDGFCSPQGSWGHCMEFRATFTAKGNKPGLVCQNSWGDYLKDGNDKIELATGETVQLPQGCFGVDGDTADSMLKQNDSFGYADASGFQAKTLNWLI